MKYKLRSKPEEVEVPDIAEFDLELLVAKRFPASYYTQRDLGLPENLAAYDFAVLDFAGNPARDSFYKAALEQDAAIWQIAKVQLPVPDAKARICSVGIGPPYRAVGALRTLDGTIDGLMLEGVAMVEDFGEVNLKEWWIGCAGKDDFEFSKSLASLYYSCFAQNLLTFDFDHHARVLCEVLCEKWYSTLFEGWQSVEFDGQIYKVENPEKRFFLSTIPTPIGQIYDFFRRMEEPSRFFVDARLHK